MFCKYCGKEVDEDSIYCKHCGKELSYGGQAPTDSSKPGPKSWLNGVAQAITSRIGLTKNSPQLSGQSPVSSEPTKVVIIRTYHLMEFAALRGKMKLQRNYDKKTCSYVVSYAFVDGSGKTTTVLPDGDTVSLTAADISSQKHSLVVNEYSDGTFVLARKQTQATQEKATPSYMTATRHEDEIP